MTQEENHREIPRSYSDIKDISNTTIVRYFGSHMNLTYLDYFSHPMIIKLPKDILSSSPVIGPKGTGVTLQI